MASKTIKMKNIIALLLVLSSFVSEAQMTQTNSNSVILYEKTQSQNMASMTYVPWTISNKGGPGIASFYYKIQQTEIDGEWQYDLWLYSNSYYANGQACSTYISNLEIYADNVLIKKVDWVLFKDKYNTRYMNFYLNKQNPYISLKWGEIKIY